MSGQMDMAAVAAGRCRKSWGQTVGGKREDVRGLPGTGYGRASARLGESIGFPCAPSQGAAPTLGEDDCHIRGKATVVRRDDTVSLSEQTAAALGQAWELRHILVCRATPGTYSRRTGRKSECVQSEDFRPACRWDAPEAACAALRADDGIRCRGSRYDMDGLLAGGHGYRTAASGAV
jgi:hypothetical protein